ncbi:MAG: helix-hairpin-helix domain-containing protein, partial [Promethearchaeota archaeon]
MKNKEIARIFLKIADLLELQEDSYKPRAYRRAARSLEQLDEDIDDIAVRGELEDIRSVGKALAKKIEEYLKTGDIEYLHRLREEINPGLIELLQIPDVGPKTVRVLHEELGISSIEELR